LTGAESLLRTAAAAGLDVCFANPGTTELDLVKALDGSGVRPVLGLFEGVCSGAADGFARMAARPALVLLHLGPGLANGLANLHNAAKGRTPVVVLVGDHATTHRGRGAPLEADVEGFARPVSCWVRTSASASALADDFAEALEAATTAPGVATLIVPADCAWGEADVAPGGERPRVGGGAVGRAAASLRSRVDDAAVSQAAEALQGADGVLLLGAGALASEDAVRAAGRVAAATGCRLLAETFPARMERGGDLPAIPRLDYFPEEATGTLGGSSALVLAGAAAPVAFFAYPGVRSEISPPGLPVHVLSEAGQDAVDALERLADRLGAPDGDGAQAAPAPRAPEPGRLTLASLGAAVAAAQPEGAIVVDEGITASAAYWDASAGARRHTLLALTGGAIGWGPPTATGAAVACPDRPVLNLQADGSAMYTLQALWTQERERLNVTTIIVANRRYRILEVEMARAGIEEPGAALAPLTDLGSPVLDWTALARGMGVPASRATTGGELVAALQRARAEAGPHLIEALV
jgi:acetolactate synthase-1/2/3 large subunit